MPFVPTLSMQYNLHTLNFEEWRANISIRNEHEMIWCAAAEEILISNSAKFDTICDLINIFTWNLLTISRQTLCYAEYWKNLHSSDYNALRWKWNNNYRKILWSTKEEIRDEIFIIRWLVRVHHYYIISSSSRVSSAQKKWVKFWCEGEKTGNGWLFASRSLSFGK